MISVLILSSKIDKKSVKYFKKLNEHK